MDIIHPSEFNTSQKEFIMFENMTTEGIVATIKEKYKIDFVDNKQLEETISSAFEKKFLEQLNYLDEHGNTANIQTKLFLFDLSVFEDFIQDNPDFNYNKLIAGTHDDIDMSAFYNNHDEMANTFGYRYDFERNVQDCTYDCYLHLLDVEGELQLVMVIISEE